MNKNVPQVSNNFSNDFNPADGNKQDTNIGTPSHGSHLSSHSAKMSQPTNVSYINDPTRHHQQFYPQIPIQDPNFL